MYFVQFVSHQKKREQKRDDEREREGREINEKRKKGFIADLQVRGSAPYLSEKAIQDCAVSVSKVD